MLERRKIINKVTLNSKKKYFSPQKVMKLKEYLNFNFSKSRIKENLRSLSNKMTSIYKNYTKEVITSFCLINALRQKCISYF